MKYFACLKTWVKCPNRNKISNYILMKRFKNLEIYFPYLPFQNILQYPEFYQKTLHQKYLFVKKSLHINQLLYPWYESENRLFTKYIFMNDTLFARDKLVINGNLRLISILKHYSGKSKSGTSHFLNLFRQLINERISYQFLTKILILLLWLF